MGFALEIIFGWVLHYIENTGEVVKIEIGQVFPWWKNEQKDSKKITV